MSTRLSRSAVVIFVAVLFSSPTAADEPLSLQHADTYTGSQAVTGWLMSEKLDGIRGYWTGKELVTRQGRRIHAPGWFTANFPSFALDGELWRRRNDFAFVQNTVLDSIPSDDWKAITYNIFEVPEASGDFPARLGKAGAWFADHPAPHVHLIEQTVCQGPDHLTAFLEKIETLGGEGVIVKDPVLEFHSGRSPYVLKVKKFSDMEGRVIGYNPGKGHFRGMLGSLVLELENGIVFNLGTGFTTAERKHPPAVGARVTFKFQGFTQNGVPRFASFMRVRED